ncbi:tigger transposable element-derived protein [Anaeramoeba flamelloides]|uniref:Tigger transposable element-derived protein n=1 Tax=Anaeramoeba flamelloides TaxID=1746091 RepID=A0ABQ8YXG7_9EUKA|nr:tigger transposable element-derived protein [Anaeramoeba flamelloides]
MNQSLKHYLCFSEIRSLNSNLEKAVQIYILSQEEKRGLSYRFLSDYFQVPKSTLHDAVKSYRRFQRAGKSGRPLLLSKNEEILLCRFVRHKANIGECLTKEETLEHANDLIHKWIQTNENPQRKRQLISSKMWVNGFALRNEFVIKKVTNLEQSRAYVTLKELKSFWDKLEDLFQKNSYLPEFIFNCDETVVGSYKKRNTFVGLTPKDKNKAHRIFKKINIHTTLLVTISASGSHLPSLLITPRKTLVKSYLSTEITNDLCFTHGPKGWITKEIFHNWVRDIFIPLINERRNDQNIPVLLVLDGHSSRLDLDSLESLAKANIQVAVIPAHSSHITQPLDRTTFSVFKNHLRKSTLETKLEKNLETILDCLQKSLTIKTIKSGFSRAGIYPLDFEKIEEIADSNIIEQTHSKPVRKKRKTIKISGKIITSEKFLKKLSDKVEKH